MQVGQFAEGTSLAISIDAADELLSTTRAVRRRLDFTRSVPRELILECVRLSQQSPTGGNRQTWRWMIVTDAEKRLALADLYRSIASEMFPKASAHARTAGEAQTADVYDAASYLADHMHEVPALVIPCLLGRPPEGLAGQAAYYGSIYPAVWSFSLAARARGLGTALTTVHLMREREAAAILGIPDDVTQTALLPIAYVTGGDNFKPTQRPPAEEITFWDQWGSN
jgi:nitroreductase